VAEGVARAYEYVLALAEEETPRPVEPSLLLDIHRVGFEHIFDWAGKWRAVELDNPPRTTPPWHIVEHVRVLCDDLAYRLARLPEAESTGYRHAVVEMLSWFQHRYVQIHPFRDFNGRTARILTTYILLQLGLPVIREDADEGEGRRRYIAAMKAADDHDAEPLRALIAEALSKAEAEPG
jgi:cell filamentation protein